jgi:hypothetical protein
MRTLAFCPLQNVLIPTAVASVFPKILCFFIFLALIVPGARFAFSSFFFKVSRVLIVYQDFFSLFPIPSPSVWV